MDVTGSVHFSGCRPDRCTRSYNSPRSCQARRGALPLRALASLLLCWAGMPAGALLCLLLTGCLVPLPLEQQNPGGGSVLMVRGAMPPFGVMRAIRQTDAIPFSVEVETDSPGLAARLYMQLTDGCCNLTINNPSATQYLRDATEITPLGMGQFRVSFGSVVPCYPKELSGATAYLVPVITTGHFLGGPTESVDTDGLTDRTHFWGVRCP